MKHTLTLATSAVLMLGLTGCDQIKSFGNNETPQAEQSAQADPAYAPIEVGKAPEPEEPQRITTSESKASIDWNAARQDMASIPSDERDGSFQVASGQTAPPVPVLLPTGIVVVQGTGNQPRFQPLTDGYYAAYPGIDYDIIVNGTNEVLGSPLDAAEGADTIRFQSTGSGAMVSFSKYGADYLVEFECKNIQGDNPDCITEEDAIKTARDLIIAGTR